MVGHHSILHQGLVILVSKVEDFNAPEPTGWTPIHFAARNGYTEMFEFLASKVADLNAPDAAGWTQIHSCLLYTSPSPRDLSTSRMPSSA